MSNKPGDYEYESAYTPEEVQHAANLYLERLRNYGEGSISHSIFHAPEDAPYPTLANIRDQLAFIKYLHTLCQEAQKTSTST